MARRRWNYDTIQQALDGDNQYIQVGYTGDQTPHKEGDVWEERGFKWTIKNGTKIRINEQADLIRELVRQKCSNCGFDIGMLGNKLDHKVFGKTGKCFDCLTLEHTVQVCDGTYKEKTEQKMLRNKLSLAKEFKRHTQETLDYLTKDDSKIELVHEDGSLTTFKGSMNEALLVEVKKDLEKVDALIKELEDYFAAKNSNPK